MLKVVKLVRSFLFVLSGIMQFIQAILTGKITKKSFIDCFPPGFWFGVVNPISSLSFRSQDLSGQVVVVTGANIGVGRSTACILTKMGATVVLACRDASRGEEAAKWIEGERRGAISSRGGDPEDRYPHAHNGRAVFARLDLADLQSVTRFVSHELPAAFASLDPVHCLRRVDVLVCNAGLNYRGVTVHGLQQLFQVNYLGHHLLVREMMPLLQSAAGNSGDGAHVDTTPPSSGRVVCLSSLCHHLSRGGRFSNSATTNIAFPPVLEWYHGYYDDSKYYMNLLALEVNRRYSGVEYVEVAQGGGRAGVVGEGGGSFVSAHSTAPATRATAAASASATAVSASSLPRPVTAVCANPGAVRSDIWRSIPAPLLLLFDWLLMRPFFLTVEQGAATSVYGALVPLDLRQQDRRQACGEVMPGVKDAGCGADCLVELEDNEEAVVGGVMHPFMPYLTPYSDLLPRTLGVGGWGGIVMHEVMGVYVGPQWGAVSLPQAHVTVAAGELWDYSVSLCEGILTAKQDVPR